MKDPFEHNPALIEAVMPAFKEHLLKPNNKRILFSGRFGSGKTYFLRWFFSEEVPYHTKQYEVFHLYPVHYSIASNEDIIPYLKYDILVSIIQRGWAVDDIQIDPIAALPSFLQIKKWEFLMRFMSYIPKVGKDIETLSQFLKQQAATFKEMNQTDGDKIADFMDQVEAMRSSVADAQVDNVLQKLFEENCPKEGENKKERVLIIDDLDRIDPEHIFRILNVFAAHIYDDRAVSTALSFDKIILVGDVDNLKSIFAAKYGLQSDFNGYIDKFYSQEIFRFDNLKAVLVYCQQVFENPPFSGYGSLTYGNKRNLEYHKTRCFFLPIIVDAVSQGHLNLRQLQKYLSFRKVFNVSDRIEYTSSFSLILDHHPFLLQYLIYHELIGSLDRLEGHWSSINTHTLESLSTWRFFEYMLMYVDQRNHRYDRSRPHHYTIPNSVSLTYEIDFQNHSSYDIPFLRIVSSGSLNISVQMIRGIMPLFLLEMKRILFNINPLIED